jgi:hypothetical protein
VEEIINGPTMTYVFPTNFGKGACEEKMISSLQNRVIAKHT